MINLIIIALIISFFILILSFFVLPKYFMLFVFMLSGFFLTIVSKYHFDNPILFDKFGLTVIKKISLDEKIAIFHEVRDLLSKKTPIIANINFEDISVYITDLHTAADVKLTIINALLTQALLQITETIKDPTFLEKVSLFLSTHSYTIIGVICVVVVGIFSYNWLMPGTSHTAPTEIAADIEQINENILNLATAVKAQNARVTILGDYAQDFYHKAQHVNETVKSHSVQIAELNEGLKGYSVKTVELYETVKRHREVIVDLQQRSEASSKMVLYMTDLNIDNASKIQSILTTLKEHSDLLEDSGATLNLVLSQLKSKKLINLDE